MVDRLLSHFPTSWLERRAPSTELGIKLATKIMGILQDNPRSMVKADENDSPRTPSFSLSALMG